MNGLEDYYIIKNNRKMRFGYTTGSCAAAAAKGAARMLLGGKRQEQVDLLTPKGILLHLRLEDIVMEEQQVSCCVVKDAGDDPDTTDGLRIYASVTRCPEREFSVEGGPGVGRVTKPGLDQPVGEAAINHVPRSMILAALREACAAYGWEGGLRAVISVPGGEDLQSQAGDRGRHLHPRHHRHRRTHERGGPGGEHRGGDAPAVRDGGPVAAGHPRQLRPGISPEGDQPSVGNEYQMQQLCGRDH